MNEESIRGREMDSRENLDDNPDFLSVPSIHLTAKEEHKKKAIM